MPRATQTAPKEPKKEAAAPDPQKDAPATQKPAQRPVQTTQSSREGMVIEGRVPVLELYEPEPISDADLAKLNVHQRWNRMIGEMGIIPKRGWNDHHKYWFTTDADLNAFVGPLLHKFHLTVFPTVLWEHVQRFETAGKQYVTRVPMLIRVVNADKPDDRLEIPWMGEGGDTVDKGLYKALTGGLKYFFMKTLQVATGDDPEVFVKTDQLAEGAAVAAQRAPQQRSVQVRQSHAPQPQKGGRQDEVTDVQLRQVKALSNGLHYGPRGTAETFDRVLGTRIFETIDSIEDEDEAGRVLSQWIRNRTGEEVGKVLQAMGDEIAANAAAKEAEQQQPETAAAEEPGPDPSDETVGLGYDG